MGWLSGRHPQGGCDRLDYLKQLGAGALWLTPVFKNRLSDPHTYHGYGIQDFLTVDPRFGTEADLQDLVSQAHARDIYVILDMVLNHAGDVFAYDGFGDEAPWNPSTYSICWRDESGSPRQDWREAPPICPLDAAVWPEELRRNENFRRKGRGGQAGGDFCSLKEFVTDRPAWNAVEGYHQPLRNALIRAYQRAIAKFDIDGFRIDTLMYVEEDFARAFGNSMREFALSIGKENFFTFGEVWDKEEKIRAYIGRNASSPDDMVGVDAALDFPLADILPVALKGYGSPWDLSRLFEARKEFYKGHLSSHGEASRYFVTFLDNHDMSRRFYHSESTDPHRYDDQLTMGTALLMALQGIPCIYYGTEQGLHGAGDKDLAVREALWGKPNAFDTDHAFFREIQTMSSLRCGYPALRFGRQYFRPISGDGFHFGISTTRPGVIAFSRILDDSEVLVVANTHTIDPWRGHILVDFALTNVSARWDLLYSNKRPAAANTIPACEISSNGSSIGSRTLGQPIRAVSVALDPMEIQILSCRR